MAMTKLIETGNLENTLREFADRRDWGPYHSPKNLVMALAGEVGELTEIFQWMTEEQSRNAMADAAVATHIGEEIADVLLYLVQIAQVLKVDLNAVVARKIALNAKKYPPPEK
ncbi:nucleotide pyrophosphohydrolase [Oxalobacteraceae bacterium CAVE-383]|nr:nucleotide pyrophosphohydrolase [Oxalobacteraceae bacterium CAVE-383]